MCYFISGNDADSFTNRDPILPLRKVWALVGSANVWVNMQENVAPALVSYNLLDAQAWQPFL
jgi:hypothetical protein